MGQIIFAQLIFGAGRRLQMIFLSESPQGDLGVRHPEATASFLLLFISSALTKLSGSASGPRHHPERAGYLASD
jgi:hypothetical protein